MRRPLALFLLLGVTACSAVETGVTATRTTLVTGTGEAAAVVALPNGGLRWADRLAGTINELTVDGARKPPLATIPVSTDGQRGVIGLAVDSTDRTFATWVEPGNGAIVVGQVAPGPLREVWRGPQSSTLANGGTLRFLEDDRLLVAIGDLEKTPQGGRLLVVDPDGAPGQEPAVLSTGWNNPFAVGLGRNAAVWVADNSPVQGGERLTRGDQGTAGAAPVRELPKESAPSGVAVDGARLVVCSFTLGRLLVYRGATSSSAPTLVDDDAGPCTFGVTRLRDGSFAVATDDRIDRVSLR